jgi:hypothetical protein
MFQKGRRFLAALAFIGASAAVVNAGPNDDPNVLPGPPTSLILNEATRGVVFNTAAINRDGTVASCFGCDPVQTVRLGVGIYQVNFFDNVQATNGWSRWVQPDTLSTGSLDAYCTTADRAGVPTAIFVQCQAPGGPGSQGRSAPVDTSFFLFVAR